LPVSSLIVLGIVGIWILVLVPMWLNRHDADSASRSMDSFSTAMRVLSRRPPARPDRRYVVMPRRDSWGATVDNHPDATTQGRFGAEGRFGARPRLRLPRLTGRRAAVSTGSRPISGRARVLARRRRIALAFAVLTIGLAVSAFVLHTSWWLEVAADLLLAGYLVHLRNEAIRVADNRRRRMARAARLANGSPSLDYAVRSRDTAVGRRVVGAGSDVDALVGITAASASGTENGSRWEPVPVPLPTYVSKPVVQRPAASAPRADVESGTTIDLTRPGTWAESQGDQQVDVRHLLLDETGSGTISASSGAPRSRPVVDVEDDELDVILARRRAVGD
jgi:hypothetical protein